MSHFTQDQKIAAAALLEWYVAMGVDCALSETPIDWRNRKAAHPLATAGPAASHTAASGQPTQASQTSQASQASQASQGQSHQNSSGQNPIGQDQFHASAPPQARAAGRFAAAPSPGEAASQAKEQARSAKTLDALEAILRQFDGCPLKTTAKNLCFYRGSATAPLAIIGEAPGRDEDIAGKPFVGRAGQLLDKMLASIGLDENNVHITNVVYWRPPGNRTPTPLEAQICRPFLMRQLELLNPEMILVLGGAAAKNMLDITEGIMRVRGKWKTLKVGDRDVPVMASLHPAYLLRTPAAKRLAWRDLLNVQAAQKTAAQKTK